MKNGKLTNSIKTVADLFNGKYVQLRKYFAGIEWDDIPKLDEDTLISAANENEKALMKVFLSDKLMSIWTCGIEQGSLRGRVSSSIFSSDDRYSIKDLLEEKPNQEKSKLDLSANGLIDRDMEFVRKIVQEKFPNLEILNLSENRFSGRGNTENFDEMVLQIISRVKKFIVLTSNPFATIDRKDFFTSEKFGSEVAKKLIWIFEKDLESGVWKCLVPNDNEKQNLVLKAHETYYQEY